VDLAGHTRDNRTGIFARRAAPVQVNYLGLPATMGAGYIDYVIADRQLIPASRRAFYEERVVWLPDSFQPPDDRRVASAARPWVSFGLPAEGVILCSFNNCAKLNPELFDIWMRVLAAAPTAVLWLLSTHPAVEQNLRSEALTRGIAGSRLVFAGRAPYADYLGQYAHADLFLDSLPFNAGATASDALSQSLPVLTCTGDAFASRMTSSLLTVLGLQELVTRSPAEYEAKAHALAGDPAALRRLRRELTEQRDSHPFFDTQRYCLQLEAAFREMWRRNEAGLEPAAIELGASG
jgi:predicted O-linked N-acetylglucosamine transferase (SPINDLY family)